VPCWSWRGCTGTPTVVEVYTQAPFAKLYLNGRHVGTKRVRDCLATFKVNYEPGTLVALACDRDGHTVGRADLRSAGEPVGLRLTREPRHMPGQDGPGSVVFVDVCACDPEGIVEGGVDREVSVSVEGGELLSFGSAAQKSERSYLEGTFSLRHGRALAVVRLGEGSCTLRAQASGLLPAELTL
jgi:beta-galactosidase